MQYDDFKAQVDEGARCVEAKNYAEAIRIFENLVASDLPEQDKAVVCVNLAIVHEKMNEVDRACRLYDRAIEHERGLNRSWASEVKAEFLTRLGRYAESQGLYEQILGRSDLSAGDRARIDANLRSVMNLQTDRSAQPLFCPDLKTGGNLQIWGSPHGLWTVSATLLGVGALLVAAFRVPVWPDEARSAMTVLGLSFGGISAIVFLAGLLLRRMRLELDNRLIRYSTLLRCCELEVGEITAVSWDTAVMTSAEPLIFWNGPNPALTVPSRVFVRSDVMRLLHALLRLRPEIRPDQAVRVTLGLAA